MAAHLSYVDEVVRLVGQDAGGFRPELTWDTVEREFGVRFPSDYRALMERFPSGDFRECVWVQNPVQSAEELMSVKRHNAGHPGPMSRVLHEILVCTGKDNLLRWDLSAIPVKFSRYLRDFWRGRAAARRGQFTTGVIRRRGPAP